MLPEDRPATREAVFTALRERRMYEAEHRIRHKDGSVRWIWARGHGVFAPEGSLRFVEGFNQDITRQRRTEEALRESEQRWRSLTEALPQLVWSATPDGACDYFSTQWTQHTGVPESDLLGWRWLATLHPDDREPTRRLWTDSVAGRGSYDVEYRVRRRDGVYRWFKTRGKPIRDSEGNIVKWFGTCTDITDLLEIEGALRASEERFRGTFENAAVGVAHRDATGRFLRVNEKFCAIVGYSREELLQKTMRDITHPDDLAASIDAFTALWQGESPTFGLEKRYVRKDGSLVWGELFASLQRDAAGKPAYDIGIINDISERKRLEEELRASEERRRLIVDNAHDAFVAMSADGLIAGWNRQAEITFGWPRAEAVGRVLSETIIPPQFREAHSRGLARFLATGEGPLLNRVIEVAALRRDGSEFPAEISIAPVRLGEHYLFVTFIRDVTERKRAEEGETRRARLAELGRDVGLALTRGDSLRGILQPCAEALVQHLDTAFARIWTLGPGEDILVLQASAGLYTHVNGSHSRVPVGHLKIGRIAQERRPHLTNDLLGDPRLSDPVWARREGMVAFAGYPLVVEARLRGVLAIFSRGPLPETVLQTLGSVAD
ncbi:MAG TPA: PAS domain S-box protein, partial [Thermoanaerobaculia bacterium]|nr:PAS domain S-box protein [Thermoanaerobaculia bacterium]